MRKRDDEAEDRVADLLGAALTPKARARFWSKVAKGEDDACWLWTGTSGSRGHGTFTVGGKTHAAHRVSWRLHRGPLPAGWMLRRTCGDPRCVNPAHLVPIHVDAVAAGSPARPMDDGPAQSRRPGHGCAHGTDARGIETQDADAQDTDAQDTDAPVKSPSEPFLAPPDEARFWRYVDRAGPAGCWLWTGGKDTKGRGYFARLGGQGPALAHRVSYQIAHGPLTANRRVWRLCGTPACVNPAHLDAVAPGAAPRGVRSSVNAPRGDSHPQARLTEERVSALRSRYADGGVSQAQLARDFGVSPGTVFCIVSRRHWRHVP